jgi:hypothetical protein
MASRLKRGDSVGWNTSQGKTRGKVVKRVTRTTRVKGHVAKATRDEPQYVVKSDKTGAKAAHKARGLTRR